MPGGGAGAAEQEAPGEEQELANAEHPSTIITISHKEAVTSPNYRTIFHDFGITHEQI